VVAAPLPDGSANELAPPAMYSLVKRHVLSENFTGPEGRFQQMRAMRSAVGTSISQSASAALK